MIGVVSIKDQKKGVKNIMPRAKKVVENPNVEEIKETQAKPKKNHRMLKRIAGGVAGFTCGVTLAVCVAPITVITLMIALPVKGAQVGADWASTGMTVEEAIARPIFNMNLEDVHETSDHEDIPSAEPVTA